MSREARLVLLLLAVVIAVPTLVNVVIYTVETWPVEKWIGAW